MTTSLKREHKKRTTEKSSTKWNRFHSLRRLAVYFFFFCLAFGLLQFSTSDRQSFTIFVIYGTSANFVLIALLWKFVHSTCLPFLCSHRFVLRSRVSFSVSIFFSFLFYYSFSFLLMSVEISSMQIFFFRLPLCVSVSR